MKIVRIQIIALLLLAGMLSGTANLFSPHRIPWVQDWSQRVEAKAREEGIPLISFSTAKKQLEQKETFFIDARPADDFRDAHILGAISLPFETIDDQFEQAIELIDSKKPLVVYCSNSECDDALYLALELKKMGAEKISLYLDGFDFWQTHGAPVEAEQ